MKCEKHKGMVNTTLVEFPADNCPHCKIEQLQAERDKLMNALDIMCLCWSIYRDSYDEDLVYTEDDMNLAYKQARELV